MIYDLGHEYKQYIIGEDANPAENHSKNIVGNFGMLQPLRF